MRAADDAAQRRQASERAGEAGLAMLRVRPYTAVFE